MEFYNNFLRLCANRGLSPSAAAAAIGFDKSAVTRWKNGKTPTERIVRAICDYFGVSRDALYSPDFSIEEFRTSENYTREEKMLVACWRRADSRQRKYIASILEEVGFFYEEPAKRENVV